MQLTVKTKQISKNSQKEAVKLQVVAKKNLDKKIKKTNVLAKIILDKEVKKI